MLSLLCTVYWCKIFELTTTVYVKIVYIIVRYWAVLEKVCLPPHGLDFQIFFFKIKSWNKNPLFSHRFSEAIQTGAQDTNFYVFLLWISRKLFAK